MSAPRFSILIPTYNRAVLVKETLDSIFAQSFQNFEVIVVDNNSTDNTTEVLQKYDRRLHVLHQENHGPEPARHNASKVATGDYFILLDSDDLLLPQALETYERVIQECSEPPVIISALEEFRDHYVPSPQTSTGVPIKFVTYENFFERDWYLVRTSSQIVVRSFVARNSAALRPAKNAFPFDTADIVLHLGAYGPWISIQQPVTLAYRLHSSNAISNLGGLLDTLPQLYENERQGDYPGGEEWRRARMAYIGELAWIWGRAALRRRQYARGMRFFLGSGLLRPLYREFWRKVQRKFDPRDLRVSEISRDGPAIDLNLPA